MDATTLAPTAPTTQAASSPSRPKLYVLKRGTCSSARTLSWRAAQFRWSLLLHLRRAPRSAEPRAPASGRRAAAPAGCPSAVPRRARPPAHSRCRHTPFCARPFGTARGKSRARESGGRGLCQQVGENNAHLPRRTRPGGARAAGHRTPCRPLWRGAPSARTCSFARRSARMGMCGRGAVQAHNLPKPSSPPSAPRFAFVQMGARKRSCLTKSPRESTNWPTASPSWSTRSSSPRRLSAASTPA